MKRRLVASMFWVVLSLPATAASQRSVPEGLPPCDGERSTRLNWRRVTFRGFELLSPSGLHPAANVSDHRGMTQRASNLKAAAP